MTYDPERYLESTARTLKDYARASFNTGIYDIMMEFPSAATLANKLPLKKTLVHFELDDIDSQPVGMGDGAFAHNYDEDTEQIFPQYAMRHILSWDVGVWASDRSGGTTSRMRARQILNFLFDINAGGIDRLRNFSDAGDGVIEIVSFSGGRFVQDTAANDVRMYRMVDCALDVRVFSRTPLPADGFPTIQEFPQDPNITIIG